MRNIIIMGVQGSGKGTQAKEMAKILNLPHISVGDIFRDHIKNSTELGTRIKKYIDNGEHVPDTVVIDVVKNRLEEPDAKEGFILDGFPRNAIQMAALEYLRPVSYAVMLDLDEQTAIDRIQSRSICKKCGKIYGLNETPKTAGICDACGTAIAVREDDQKIEVIKKRLELFYKEIEFLVPYYEWKKVLCKIKASNTPEVILEDILKEIGFKK